MKRITLEIARREFPELSPYSDEEVELLISDCYSFAALCYDINQSLSTGDITKGSHRNTTGGDNE